jgi:hypothetical protein
MVAIVVMGVGVERCVAVARENGTAMTTSSSGAVAFSGHSASRGWLDLDA